MVDPAEKRNQRQASTAQAGGFFIFIGLLLGSILGIIWDQPSIGMVGGLAAGGLAAIVLWLLDRRRQ